MILFILSMVSLSKFDNDGFSHNLTIRSPNICTSGNTNSSIVYKNISIM